VVLLFYLYNAQKHTLFTFCDTLAGILLNCFVCQLLAVKLLEMLAHCANTDTETLSSFTDSSIDNVLLRINPDFVSRFLNL